MAVVDEIRTHFQLYYVVTEPTCSIWTDGSVVEQMPAKGMVVSSSLARSVGFPTGLAALPTMPRAENILSIILKKKIHNQIEILF